MGKQFLEERELLGETQQVAVCAFVAGGASGLVLGPVDLVKVRAQVERREFMSYRRGVRELVRAEGLGAVRKGLGVALWRYALGWASYLGIYHHSKQLLGVDRATSHSLRINVAAASACLHWLLIYPLEATRILILTNQTQTLSALQAFNTIYAQAGLRGFFKGCPIAVFRGAL